MDLARETPYLVPQKAGLELVQSLIQARIGEWKDYAFVMREDPSFFADVVGDWSEHSSVQVRSPDRKVHPDLTNAICKRNFWDNTVSSAINEVYEHLVMWAVVNKQLEAVIALQKDRSDELPPKVDDISGVEIEVRRLKFILEIRVIGKMRRELGFILPSSSPMRSMFQSHNQALELQSDVRKDDCFLWIGQELWEGRDLVPEYILAMELNRIIQEDKTQKERITPMVARCFSDLAIAYNLRTRLAMMFPNVFSEKKDTESEKAAVSMWTKDPSILALYDLKMIAGPSHAGSKFLRLGSIGEPTTLPYPVNKRHTKETVEIMQRSEQQLDLLWDRYDEHLKKHLKPVTNAILQSGMPEKGELQRTGNWVEPEKPARKRQAGTPSEFIPLSESGQQQDSDIALPFRKEKPKTKGAAVKNSVAIDTSASQAEAVSRPGPHFTLGKKAYHTFSTIFYQPSSSSQPGEVAWGDFVWAMSAISFVPEKLYGSAWRFTPKDISTFRTKIPINFHEPHPNPNLPFRTARLYGRRLTRHYGIEGSCFVLGN